MSAPAEGPDAPVLSRDPAGLPPELPRGADLPEDHDPLADGILMQHQADWIADESDLKLAKKGRRTGVTYAEALDATLIAAKARSAGGQNYFYIGDTKDKGREFIGYVAHFARVVSRELVAIEEFLFEDERADGETKFISAFRVRFASGRRVEALSSRPENIRGLQGTVCIDEAAFHKDVRGALDAVNALLIWGGKIRIISTHNGVLSPFNELIREAEAGKVPFSIHHIPFADAVRNGLYKRVCLISGKAWSAEAEAAWEAVIRGSYGSRTAKMRQELDAIPTESEGAALTRVTIESCMEQGIPVVRWALPQEMKEAAKAIRDRTVREFCETKLLPILKRLEPRRQHAYGQDYARHGDGSCIVLAETDALLRRRARLVVEMHNVPYEMQRDVVFFVLDHVPYLVGAAFDAGGNGEALAEVARQRYGQRVLEIKLSRPWYQLNMPRYIEAFGDGTIILPADEDILRDHQALTYDNGVAKVPDDMRFKGSDGFDRHGDTAIAGALMWHASLLSPIAYDYESLASRAQERRDSGLPHDDEDEGADFSRALW